MKTRLIELIEKKAFSELVEEEKRFVLSEISEQEYNSKHQLMAKIKSELKTEAKQLNAKSSIHQNALAALKAKNIAKEEMEAEKEEEKNRVGFFAFKIPLWTAIAAVFVVLMLVTPVLINSEFDDKSDAGLVAMVDTVYIDKIVRDTIEIIQPADTVVKTFYTSKEDINTKRDGSLENRPTEVYINSLDREGSDYDLQNSVTMGNYPQTFDFKNSNSGKSLSEDKIGKMILNATE